MRQDWRVDCRTFLSDHWKRSICGCVVRVIVACRLSNGTSILEDALFKATLRRLLDFEDLEEP